MIKYGIIWELSSNDPLWPRKWPDIFIYCTMRLRTLLEVTKASDPPKKHIKFGQNCHKGSNCPKKYLIGRFLEKASGVFTVKDHIVWESSIGSGICLCILFVLKPTVGCLPNPNWLYPPSRLKSKVWL